MWSSVCFLIGQTIATTVTIKIQDKWNINLAYRSYGLLAIMIGLISIVLLKDYNDKQGKDNNEQEKEPVKLRESL